LRRLVEPRGGSFSFPRVSRIQGLSTFVIDLNVPS
jgi:hypothetical protein